MFPPNYTQHPNDFFQVHAILPVFSIISVWHSCFSAMPTQAVLLWDFEHLATLRRGTCRCLCFSGWTWHPLAGKIYNHCCKTKKNILGSLLRSLLAPLLCLSLQYFRLVPGAFRKKNGWICCFPFFCIALNLALNEQNLNIKKICAVLCKPTACMRGKSTRFAVPKVHL